MIVILTPCVVIKKKMCFVIQNNVENIVRWSEDELKSLLHFQENKFREQYSGPKWKFDELVTTNEF